MFRKYTQSVKQHGWKHLVMLFHLLYLFASEPVHPIDLQKHRDDLEFLLDSVFCAMVPVEREIVFDVGNWVSNF